MQKLRAFIVEKPLVCCAVSIGIGLLLGAIGASV